MLAAQYVYRSRNDPHLRFALKVKLFNLLRNHSNIHFERTVKLFIFVRDLIHLPKKLENEFEVNQFSLVFPNEPTMIVTQGTKNFTEKLYEHVFGYNPAEVMAKERQKAELEFQKKAELERQLLLTHTIHNLRQLAKMDVAQIALMMGITEAEVQEILNSQTSSQQEWSEPFLRIQLWDNFAALAKVWKDFSLHRPANRGSG